MEESETKPQLTQRQLSNEQMDELCKIINDPTNVKKQQFLEKYGVKKEEFIVAECEWPGAAPRDMHAQEARERLRQSSPGYPGPFSR